MLQFSSSNYQFTMNYQLPITNQKNLNATRFPSMKIENCELKIEISGGNL